MAQATTAEIDRTLEKSLEFGSAEYAKTGFDFPPRKCGHSKLYTFAHTARKQRNADQSKMTWALSGTRLRVIVPEEDLNRQCTETALELGATVLVGNADEDEAQVVVATCAAGPLFLVRAGCHPMTFETVMA